MIRSLVWLSCLTFLCSNASSEAASVYFAHLQDAGAVYLDGEELNGEFNSIYFKVFPRFGTFMNANSGVSAGVPRPVGQKFTYPNRMLNAASDDPDFEGGLGLIMSELINTPQELSFTVDRPGGMITTANQPGGNLFLGNYFPSIRGSGFTVVRLLRDGVPVFEKMFAEYPEPGTATLAMSSLLGFVAVRRRLAACPCSRKRSWRGAV